MDLLRALDVLVRVVEVGSFSAVARERRMSSAAVTRLVAQLEDHFGVRLFHRSTRSITLTQEGKLFLESSRRIFAEVEAVELEFAQTRGTPRGKLRVSLPLIGMLLMPTLAQFMRAYPDIELDMVARQVDELFEAPIVEQQPALEGPFRLYGKAYS